MNENAFLQAVQSRVARGAVGASAARGRGNTGVVTAARQHFVRLNVARFRAGPVAFRRALDRETEALRAALPKSARHWGLARKLLNIFLRDCLYTTYLAEAHQLARSERSFEIPLDSITALSVKRAGSRGALPQWPGVRHVTPALNDRFQEAAALQAAREGLARVHMDAIWWSRNRDAAARVLRASGIARIRADTRGQGSP